jgi:Holliday junction resolvasome RuvABC endonuclease subunit
MILFGIDPGVTRTGVVRPPGYGSKKGAFATFHSSAEFIDSPDYDRAASLGALVATWISTEVADIGEDPDIRIVIEKPIYNGNPKNFSLQWRVFQSILLGIAAAIEDFAVLEVNPKTVKEVATGNGGASKAHMIKASMFKDLDLGRVDKEALADAEGIAKCGTVVPVVGELYRINDEIKADILLSGDIYRLNPNEDTNNEIDDIH